MKAVKILSYVFYTAVLVLVICGMLNFKIKYFGPILGSVLVASSVLFFLDAYKARKDKR